MLLNPLSSETLVTLNIGFIESLYLIFSLVTGSTLDTAYQFVVCKYALAVGNVLSQPEYSEFTLMFASILFKTLTIIRLADFMSWNIVCLGLKLIPYFSTSLNLGSGTGDASAFSPHKLSISLSLRCSGTVLLLSPSRINFQAVCEIPSGFKFLLKLICKCDSSSLISDMLCSNKLFSLAKLIISKPYPTGSAIYLAIVLMSSFLPCEDFTLLSSTVLFITQ